MCYEKKILITVPNFATTNDMPEQLLNATGWNILKNPHNRTLKQEELKELIKGVYGVIAGLEEYTASLLIDHADTLKVIARVGSGYDNVDILAAHEYGITVTNTPDAPAQAVAELTVAQIINLSRDVVSSNQRVHNKVWVRTNGALLCEVRVGILGLGRIGKCVAKLLHGFGSCVQACDVTPDKDFIRHYGITLLTADELFATSDIITIHIPLSCSNRHYVNRRFISLMRPSSSIINTSRGAVVDETALIDALREKRISGAALDVFEKEPYRGHLIGLDNVILTPHLGGSARKSRCDMESQAVEDCIRVLNGYAPIRPVPVT